MTSSCPAAGRPLSGIAPRLTGRAVIVEDVDPDGGEQPVGTTAFHAFAPGAAGPWRSAAQRRRDQVEGPSPTGPIEAGRLRKPCSIEATMT